MHTNLLFIAIYLIINKLKIITSYFRVVKSWISQIHNLFFKYILKRYKHLL